MANDDAFHLDHRSVGVDPSAKEPVLPETVSDRFVSEAVLGGRYRMRVSHGRGGMGEACRAEDFMLGDVVTLKLQPHDAPRSASPKA